MAEKQFVVNDELLLAGICPNDIEFMLTHFPNLYFEHECTVMIVKDKGTLELLKSMVCVIGTYNELDASIGFLILTRLFLQPWGI